MCYRAAQWKSHCGWDDWVLSYTGAGKHQATKNRNDWVARLTEPQAERTKIGSEDCVFNAMMARLRFMIWNHMASS